LATASAISCACGGDLFQNVDHAPSLRRRRAARPGMPASASTQLFARGGTLTGLARSGCETGTGDHGDQEGIVTYGPFRQPAIISPAEYRGLRRQVRRGELGVLCEIGSHPSYLHSPHHGIAGVQQNISYRRSCSRATSSDPHAVEITESACASARDAQHRDGRVAAVSDITSVHLDKGAHVPPASRGCLPGRRGLAGW
jgi:hypothetical protein